MAVTPEDRAYMRRIAAYKALSAAEDHVVHVDTSGVGRIRRSWQLYCRYLHTPFLARRDADDNPAAFYERARQLGLYRPWD